MLVLLAGAVLLTAAVLSMPVFAADEDTQASVYLVFDPETGEFVTMHDTEGAAKAQETQEAIQSVADVGNSSAAGVAASPAAPADAASQTSTSPKLIVGLVVVALAVIGGAVFLQRRA